MFVIHLGTSGFPVGNNAVIQRIKLIHKGLKIAGCNPLIISKHSTHNVLNNKRLNRYQGIPYISTSFLISRPENFMIRNLNKLSGKIGELHFLVRKRKKIQTAILSGVSFYELIYYWILSKLLGFKVVIQYVEYVTAMNKSKNPFKLLNVKLLDNFRFFFCDGIIVISEFLKNHTLSRIKTLPILKIPAICDFEAFNNVPDVKPTEYLMYCGSIGYISVIAFVVELYEKLRTLNSYQGKLLLAIGVGEKSGEAYSKLEIKIRESFYSDSIILLKNVSHQELIKIYLEAELLIVPMRDELQDIAGFHHKVGEYCAAAKPIISTRLGEMAYYFEDGISAILAEEYTMDSYLQKLTQVLADKEKLKSIAQKGNKVGLTKLNYLNYGHELKQFIECC